MGLAAPKRRLKLSHDPNNTQWSKSSDNYGQKILSAQGWKPGDYLGASNASHSDHYTVASASHVKIFLREENLGLGAQIGKGNAETFGLSLYSGVLSRLNGKSDVEVQKHQDALRDAELRIYQTQKSGSMHFVSGGFLVGDTIRPKEQSLTEPRVLEKTGEKRKGDAQSKDARLGEKTAKRRKDGEAFTQKSKGARKKDAAESTQNLDISISLSSSTVDPQHSTGSSLKEAHSNVLEDGANGTVPSSSKKSKKKKKRSDIDSEDTEHQMAKDTDRPRSNEDKRARKEERRRRKLKRNQLESDQHAPHPQPFHPQQISVEPAVPDVRSAGTGNRHAIRRRYIDQKRMSSLSAQAMKEIFMVTAKG